MSNNSLTEKLLLENDEENICITVTELDSNKGTYTPINPEPELPIIVNKPKTSTKPNDAK
tara:strand:+ start:329 stop:508 length:180 start_codon:yes stop_codon:yes gene_type:complete